jgi:SSS family solute:Na+ symporter
MSLALTNFSWPIDGSIVGIYLLATMVAGLVVRKYVGRVEDFLVAGREMNVYLGIASLAATEFGIITCMYTAQSGYKYGFAGVTPGILQFLAMFLVGWTGFCVKPLRDSGVMTIPELLERKFGARIRWLAGVVIVLGGLLNMGVFLKIGGEFLILVCGFDPGPGARNLKIMMGLLLLGVSIYTILGGMLSVLVTDFLQFVVMSFGLILVTLLILFDERLGWTTLVSTVETKIGPGGFNPFKHPEMGWPYVIFFCFLQLAAVLTWQTVIQRLLAAKDTRTGRRVYTGTSFFFVCRFLIPAIWGIASLAMIAPAAVEALPGGMNTPSLDSMPLFLGAHMPIGLMGILIAAMLAADMSTDSSYMLTWGSVIYNDILAPFRKTPWPESKGLLWNRAIIAAIGVFLLVFGLLYEPQIDIWAYLGVTGTVYLSSMSVLLVAACYWKGANDWGAAAAIALGAVIPIGYLVLEKLPATAQYAAKIGPYYSGIAAYVCTALAMVVGSLIKPMNEARETPETPEART